MNEEKEFIREEDVEDLQTNYEAKRIKADTEMIELEIEQYKIANELSIELDKLNSMKLTCEIARRNIELMNEIWNTIDINESRGAGKKLGREIWDENKEVFKKVYETNLPLLVMPAEDRK